MKPWHYLLSGILIGLLAAGVILIVASPPEGEPITLAPAPTEVQIAVYVGGEVTTPGVVYLAPGSRVQDALTAAGGTLEDADMASINPAQVVEDGERIDVPKLRPELTIGGNAEPTGGVININTATQAELESLPGVGPTTAQNIISYRSENGRFSRVDDLLKVSGIGTNLLERIRQQITVGP
jgi:competence protein ComEA